MVCSDRFISLLWFVLIVVISNSYAYDLTDKFSIGGIMAGVYQGQWVDGDDNRDRGAFNFEPEFSFRPNDNNEIFAKFGFGAGNGLSADRLVQIHVQFCRKPFPGADRRYHRRHGLCGRKCHSLGLTGGIIDATDYVDENAYANDEFTQFMNEALVNGPNGFFPSYDGGGAAEWEIGNGHECR